MSETDTDTVQRLSVISHPHWGNVPRTAVTDSQYSHYQRPPCISCLWIQLDWLRRRNLWAVSILVNPCSTLRWWVATGEWRRLTAGRDTSVEGERITIRSVHRMSLSITLTIAWIASTPVRLMSAPRSKMYAIKVKGKGKGKAGYYTYWYIAGLIVVLDKHVNYNK